MKTTEIREQLKQLVKQGAIEQLIGTTVQVANQRVHVSNGDGQGVRFDLPDQDTAFVLMSGRLYQRDLDPGAIPTESAGVLQQQNYRGELEPVDTRLFNNKIVCKCGDARWVKNADLFQVTKCKPCTYEGRRVRRRVRYKERKATRL